MTTHDQIVGEIEQARADLAHTVEEMAARLDPKTGLRRLADRLTANRERVAVVAGSAGLLIVVVALRRSGRRSRR